MNSRYPKYIYASDFQDFQDLQYLPLRLFQGFQYFYNLLQDFQKSWKKLKPTRQTTDNYMLTILKNVESFVIQLTVTSFEVWNSFKGCDDSLI